MASSPQGISCLHNVGGTQDCSQSYVDGTQVTLIAVPAPGSTFEGFAGGGCGTAASCTLTLKTSRAVGAVFAAVVETEPDTSVMSTPATRNNRHSMFAFGSTTADVTFLCSIDGDTTTACTSPTDYACLSPGRHAFRVWAVAPGGTLDSSAAQHRFRTTASRACG